MKISHNYPIIYPIPKEILTPDRHLRVLATKHLRNADSSIGGVLSQIRKEPSLLGDRGYTFDYALLRLDYFLSNPEMVTQSDNLKNLAELRGRLEGRCLYRIGSLSHEFQTDENARRDLAAVFANAEAVFPAIAELIKSDQWGYLKEVGNAGTVISAILIEGYGLFLENHYQIKELRPVFVRAFEEVLGTEFAKTNLWLEVKPWVLEEKELFSSSFIESIDSSTS